MILTPAKEIPIRVEIAFPYGYPIFEFEINNERFFTNKEDLTKYLTKQKVMNYWK